MVAKALGYVYVDTGAMYRTLAWFCDKSGLDASDEPGLGLACRKWKTKLICIDGAVRLLVNNYYPEKEIRTPEISHLVSQVAMVAPVREWMLQKQRECVKFGSLVVEGRDIGSYVFPDTNFKFYLEANLTERSRRRKAEGIRDNLEARDHRDTRRSVAPLRIAMGAMRIDTSALSPETVSRLIVQEFGRRRRSED